MRALKTGKIRVRRMQLRMRRKHLQVVIPAQFLFRASRNTRRHAGLQIRRRVRIPLVSEVLFISYIPSFVSLVCAKLQTSNAKPPLMCSIPRSSEEKTFTTLSPHKVQGLFACYEEKHYLPCRKSDTMSYEVRHNFMITLNRPNIVLTTRINENNMAKVFT